MDMYPKSRIRLSRQGVICCGDETDVPVIPDMTRVQRYCLVVGDELRGDQLGEEATSSREINHKKQAANKCASIEVFTRANHSGIHRDSSNMCHSDVCCCQIHRKRTRKLDSDVYMMLPKCRYIGMQHIWPIPMYLSTEI